MSKNEDLVEKFIKQAKTEAKVTPLVVSRKERIQMGLMVGTLAAAIYSVFAHYINILQVPGVPLLFHPFGPIGNILYTILLGGLVGAVSTWNEKAIPSMSMGSLVTVFGFVIFQLFSRGLPLFRFLLTTIGILTLLVAGGAVTATVLLIAILRWTADVQLEMPHLKFWNTQRLLPILILISVSFFAGYLHKMSGEDIFALRTTNKLIQEGLKFQDRSQLPDALKDKQAGNFISYANSNYKIEVDDTLLSIFPARFSNLELYSQDHVVVVHFDSKQNLACLISPGRTTKCIIIH